MDADQFPADDLSDLERRLSEWRPSTIGLDADGVLFAAGRASVRLGWSRIVWPALSGCLALLAVILGAGLVQERAARLELAARFRDPKPGPTAQPSAAPESNEPPSAEPPGGDSFLAAHRALAGNPDSWLAIKTEPLKGPSWPSRPIWKAGSHMDIVDP